MDVTLRVDRQIATLLDFVNTQVGLTNTLIAFTADHGVSPIPEQAKGLGLGGERLKPTDLLAAITHGHQSALQSTGKVAGSDRRLLVRRQPRLEPVARVS